MNYVKAVLIGRLTLISAQEFCCVKDPLSGSLNNTASKTHAATNLSISGERFPSKP